MIHVRKHLKDAAGFSLVWTAAKLSHRVRFERSAQIPPEGPVILVANHITMTEPLAVARLVIGHRRFPHFMVMRQVFSWPVIGHLARLAGQIPVDRGSAKAAQALESAGAQLDLGRLVVLYPEGKLTTDPDLMPGDARTGAARLALAHPQVPLVPIGQWGPKPGRSHMFHRHTSRLRVGQPIDLSPFAGRDDEATLRAATDVIMAAIRAEVVAARADHPYFARSLSDARHEH